MKQTEKEKMTPDKRNCWPTTGQRRASRIWGFDICKNSSPGLTRRCSCSCPPIHQPTWRGWRPRRRPVTISSRLGWNAKIQKYHIGLNTGQKKTVAKTRNVDEIQCTQPVRARWIVGHPNTYRVVFLTSPWILLSPNPFIKSHTLTFFSPILLLGLGLSQIQGEEVKKKHPVYPFRKFIWLKFKFKWF